MKQIFIILSCLITGFASYAQTDSARGKQFHLTGKITGEVRLTPHCGIIAWGAVIDFEIIELVGMMYSNKNIRVIVTCPEFYKKGFFETGRKYQIVFADKNQADFSWNIPDKKLLEKNKLSFDPYVVSVKKIL